MRKSNNYESGKEKFFKTEKKHSSLAWKFLNSFLFMTVLSLGVLYLFNINEIAVQGFALSEMKAEADYLAEKKRGLEEKISYEQSYYNFNSRLASLRMIEVQDVEYLKTEQASVAKK